MNCTSIVGNWYVSNAAMTLATNYVSNYSSAIFLNYASVPGTCSFLHVAGTDVEMCKSLKALHESSTVSQIVERFESNAVL